jgi:hypothetical protein
MMDFGFLWGKQSGVFDDFHGMTDGPAEVKLVTLVHSRVWGKRRAAAQSSNSWS